MNPSKAQRLLIDPLEERLLPAVQIVEPGVTTATASPGAGLTIEALYRTGNPDSQDLVGLPTLRLHYDSSKFNFSTANVSAFFTENKLGGPTIENDTQDFDGNASTDKFLFASWLSFAGKNFPDFANNPAPTTLYRARFVPTPDTTSGTSLLTFTGDAADGSTFQGGQTTVTFTESTSGLPSRYAVGAGEGGPPIVKVYNAADGNPLFELTAFDSSFTGGVRVASGDVNGDGTPDVIVGTGPGSSTLVRIFDGNSMAELASIAPFEGSFTGGVFVGAGDVTGDGKADIAISPDEGGGPRVRLFRFTGSDVSQINDFFGIDDSAFRGGARTAIADVTGNGSADLLVAAGFGGGPRLAVFRGETLGDSQPTKPFGDFFVFEQTLRNGVFVGGGDLNGDGFADVVAGGGPGGGPRIFALSGQALSQNNGEQIQVANFFAGDVNNRGGIRLGLANADDDSRADLFVGAGTGAGALVSGYAGSSIPTDGTPPTIQEFVAFDPPPAGGVFVG